MRRRQVRFHTASTLLSKHDQEQIVFFTLLCIAFFGQGPESMIANIPEKIR